MAKKFFFFIIPVIAGVLFFIFWKSIEPWQGDIQQDLIIRIRPDQAPMTLNPLMQFTTETLRLSETGMAISECLFDGLFNRKIDANGKTGYEYGIAERLSSRDGDVFSKNWIIRLRRDCYWNGTSEKVLASDVIHSYQCIDLGGNKSPWRDRLKRYMAEEPHPFTGMPEEIEFVFNVSLHRVDVMQLLSFKILPKEFKFKGRTIRLKPENMGRLNDEDWKIFNKSPIGSGPYVHSPEKSTPERIVLVSNQRQKSIENIPRHVIFKEIGDDELTTALGNTVNFALYIPNHLRSEIEKQPDIKTIDYTPFYFYALLMGEKMEESQREKIYCTINDAAKSDILEKMGVPKPGNMDYLNHGPFPWNWEIFVNYNKPPIRPVSGKETCFPDGDVSPKEEVVLLRNRGDIRTRELAIAVSDALESQFAINIQDKQPKEFIQIVREKDFELAVIIWEGFDQGYNIAKLYTEEGNPFNLVHFFEKNDTQPRLIYFFNILNTQYPEQDRYVVAKDISELVYKEKPYLFLFTPPRKAAYMKHIGNIDQYPIHPETFLANIRKWQMKN